MNERYRPSIRDMINLPLIMESAISPNGCKVAYIIRTPNWFDNCYESRCFVFDIAKNKDYQITHTGNVSNLQWFNNESLALIRADLKSEYNNQNKRQIWLFEQLIGEGIQITNHLIGIQKFKVFNSGFLYLAQNPKRAKEKEWKGALGRVIHYEQEESSFEIYYLSLQNIKEYYLQLFASDPEKVNEIEVPIITLTTQLSKNLKVIDFTPAHSQKFIYINCQFRDDLTFLDETSVYRLDLDINLSSSDYYLEDRGGLSSRINNISTFLKKFALPKGANVLDISPDDSKLLIKYPKRDRQYNTQNDLWIFDLNYLPNNWEDEMFIKANMSCITENIDQSILDASWTEHGIIISYFSNTDLKIARLSEKGELKILDFGEYKPSQNANVSLEGNISCIAENQFKLPRLISAKATDNSINVREIGCLDSSIINWDLGTSELVSWSSKDGHQIHGVLRKPSNFDSSKKYPLLVIIHGGPQSTSQNILLDNYDRFYYPCIQFINQDILIFKPNYRGSIGKGQAFLELNKDNLGLSELSDIESGIDSLIAQGFIDQKKIGCMGWSYGGYISAFALTNSSRFAAISVGAGISSWYTYYITADIPQFTLHYLSAVPFENKEIYNKTSPIFKIKEAKTPTLIQQGSEDKTVSIMNAMELYRGLKNSGMQVEFFVFPEMPHSPTKPRQSLAIMSQNFSWFSHFLLNRKLDFDIKSFTG